jgi:hypothetical protein
MASALQCPACGHKHRLSQLTGDPIFSCENCGRLLKTPMEYRRPEPSAPAAPPRPAPEPRSRSRVQRGGSAARDQTSVIPAAGPAPEPAAAPRPSKPRKTPKAPKPPKVASAPRPGRASTPAALGLPILILGWVAAIVLGGIIVRYVAKWTGLLTGDSVIDLITGSGFGRYLRLFAVVPFWALAAAGLMTLFIEGGRRWQARQQTGPVRPATKQPSAVPAPPRRPAPDRPSQEVPVREPAIRPRAPEPEPEPAPPRQPAPAPAAAESRSPAGAAAAPRPRRIPKRDISS